MGKKRKISVRKVLRTFVTIVVTSGCLVAVLGASKIHDEKALEKITLHVRNHQYRFLNKEELWNDLINKNDIIEGTTKLSSLDIKRIEKDAVKNSWISEAEVYVSNKREMHIYVTQRVPVARVFYDNGQSFYLDTALNVLPLSEQFTYYTTIVTNVPVLKEDSLNKALRAQIVRLVRFVERDSFWNAQIAQISVTPDMKFEFTPVLGTHKILFGDTTDMVEKFNNLFVFYKKVLNRIGWDTYQVIDLRFKGQIVASPAVPWQPEIKNPISNMDWVKSVISGEPINSIKPFVVKDTKEKKKNIIVRASVKQVKKQEKKQVFTTDEDDNKSNQNSSN